MVSLLPHRLRRWPLPSTTRGQGALGRGTVGTATISLGVARRQVPCTGNQQNVVSPVAFTTTTIQFRTSQPGHKVVFSQHLVDGVSQSRKRKPLSICPVQAGGDCVHSHSLARRVRIPKQEGCRTCRADQVPCRPTGCPVPQIPPGPLSRNGRYWPSRSSVPSFPELTLEESLSVRPRRETPFLGAKQFEQSFDRSIDRADVDRLAPGGRSELVKRSSCTSTVGSIH
jgi:hypothetical protein